MSKVLRSAVQTMNDSQREWFAMAMISMVLSDGSVSQAETAHLLESIAFVRNPQAVERLKKYIQFQAVPVLAPFVGWERDLKSRALLMLDLMESAIVDRDFSAKERHQFHHIGAMLGFPPGKVEELIAMGERSLENQPG